MEWCLTTTENPKRCPLSNYILEDAMVSLRDYQLEAIEKLHNGSILCGSVGSGKSRTALAYFFTKVCQGSFENGKTITEEPKTPRDLYIITTAKKRDSKEWEDECIPFIIFKNSKSIGGIKLTIDSWNNIKKYKDVTEAFFIFDEQRVVGSGSWVKAFLNIARKNQWILLSATPGDQWKDYIPVFVANGFFKNKTEFNREHVVFSRFTKYPKIERYVGEGRLIKCRNDILVTMKDERTTTRHYETIVCDYNKEAYNLVWVKRWNIYDKEPIDETGKLFYLLRKVVNSDPSRLVETGKILEANNKVIIFYNFTYELELLRDLCAGLGIKCAEWNGQVHEEIPKTKRWVYLVQYAAGCEGWNCTETDTIIFYSQSYSYRMTEQAAGRIDRMNTQFTDLYYYRLRSQSPIDLAISRALSKKKNFNERSFYPNLARTKK